MKVIEKDIETYIIEKKSKFIANIFYIENREEAEEKLKQIKKKYYDAKHNCYAYRVLENDNIIERSSDDGEPSGTAGMPILDILRGQDIVNCIIVVTRYFGGILLGTGGLVRAYLDASKNALDELKLLQIEEGYKIELVLDYKNFELFSYYCKKNNINVVKKEYGENIKIIVETSKEKKDEICGKSEKFKFKVLKSRIMSKKLIRKYIDI